VRSMACWELVRMITCSGEQAHAARGIEVGGDGRHAAADSRPDRRSRGAPSAIDATGGRAGGARCRKGKRGARRRLPAFEGQARAPVPRNALSSRATRRPRAERVAWRDAAPPRAPAARPELCHVRTVADAALQIALLRQAARNASSAVLRETPMPPASAPRRRGRARPRHQPAGQDSRSGSTHRAARAAAPRRSASRGDWTTMGIAKSDICPVIPERTRGEPGRAGRFRMMPATGWSRTKPALFGTAPARPRSLAYASG